MTTPTPAEQAANEFMMSGNPSTLDAHLIADMLRIETISMEVKTVGEKVDSALLSIKDLERTQLEHALKSELGDAKMQSTLENLQSAIAAMEERTVQRFAKIEGWIFAIIGISITALISILVSLITRLV
jgi:hypothetical protein